MYEGLTLYIERLCCACLIGVLLARATSMSNPCLELKPFPSQVHNDVYAVFIANHACICLYMHMYVCIYVH